MEIKKYPLHSQYVRLVQYIETILTNLKSKSTVLLVNDALVPPINAERSDLPWALGSKAQPWKNLYISNKSVSELTSNHSEVIDVYTTLSNAASKAELQAALTNIATVYATKALVETETTRLATMEKAGAIQLDVYEATMRGYTSDLCTLGTIMYCKVTPDRVLKDTTGAPTDYPAWTVEHSLYVDENTKYAGTDFAVKKVGDVAPGQFHPECDNYYVIVYVTGLNDICKAAEGKEIKVYRDNAVYLKDGGLAYANVKWGTIPGNISNQSDLVAFVNSTVQTATGSFCGNWNTWDAVPTTAQEFVDAGYAEPDLNCYLVIVSDTSHGHTGETWRYKYTHLVSGAEYPYQKDRWKPEYKINDTAFTAAQLAALNSSITATKVGIYDNYGVTKVSKTDYATTSMAGVVKADGTTISVAADGTLSAIGGGDVQVELGGYDWVTSASGRRFTRNEANTGTIMEWNDNGTTRWTVVFDAKYRALKPLYSDFTTNLGLTTFTNIGNTIPSAPASGSDTVLNANNNFNQDARGNTAATTEWMSKASVASYTNGAMYYARSLTALNPTGVDLPTINCLTRIYNDRVILDSMDPTVSTSPYNHYALTPWTFGSASEIWSASWYGSYSSYYCVVLVTSAGKVSGNNQNIVYGIIPVLDITNPEA